jgi:hypothetical protein
MRVLNAKRSHPDVEEMIQALSEKYAGKKVVIGRDKNDYVKGVRQKILSFERFLNLHAEFVGKVGIFDSFTFEVFFLIWDFGCLGGSHPSRLINDRRKRERVPSL